MKYFFLIFIIFFSSISFGSDKIIEERIANFKIIEKSLNNINKFANLKKFDEIISEAKVINEWLINLPSYFPAGTQASMTNNSDASSDIWNNFDKFLQLVDNTHNNTILIINSAKEENLNNLFNAINNTSKSCTQCHRLFRN